VRKGRDPRAILVLLALAVSAALRGQGVPLSTLAGRVIAEDGSPLPDVAVVAESPSLQGMRQTRTSAQGTWVLGVLPPGPYRLRFAAPGMQTVDREIVLSAAAAAQLDVALSPARVTEAVTVSADVLPVSRGPEIASNTPQALLDQLPSARTLRASVLLAPGVSDRGPKGVAFLAGTDSAILISGAHSFENLYLVNGASVNDNYRGDPQNLFIEDAIAETVVETGRISAEYGRFTGGVVNVITRSGGNRVSGSFRTTFTNDDWTANDEYNRTIGVDNRVDDLHETYEATLGFPLWRDRLWGFAAGRWADAFHSAQTRADFQIGDVEPTPVPYSYGQSERRLEGKLTAAITGSYSVIGSYTETRFDEPNWTLERDVLSKDALMRVSSRGSLLSINFNGVLSRSVFLEAQYSRRTGSGEQEGPQRADRIAGTAVVAEDRGHLGAPILSGAPESHLDSDSWLVKASWVAAAGRLGNHDLRVGWERFRDSIFLEIDFSRSGFVVAGPSAIVRGTQVFPVFGDGTAAGTARIQWFPIAAPAGTMQLVTDSGFVNDRLQLGKHWSFNLGLRYDRNHDRTAEDVLISSSHEWSPRLAARYDARGDGRWLFDAGYARYVAKMHPNLASAASGAGFPAFYQWDYRGPCINCDPAASTSSLLSLEEALRRLFEWFDAAGGTALPPNVAVYPGLASRIAPGGLRSPTAREYSLGATVALTNHGAVSANFLYRDYRDLYAGRIDLSTGTSSPDPLGNVYDIEVVGNSNAVMRQYTAVQTQARYQFSPVFFAGATWTWARLVGNAVGELRCCSAFQAQIAEYPEYRQERWNYPTGYLTGSGEDVALSQDQRHRARMWVVWQTPIKVGRVLVSALESFDSGLGYDAVARIDPKPYVVNPGYERPPGDVAYFFTRPGAYHTENVTSMDLALDWAVPVHRPLEVFLHAQVFNVFNEQAVVAVDNFVVTNLDDPTLAPFDPFHDVPVRGVNYRHSDDFGKPVGPEGYQRPRTFEFSVGLRF
jgi:carboxypeptidase family protein